MFIIKLITITNYTDMFIVLALHIKTQYTLTGSYQAFNSLLIKCLLIEPSVYLVCSAIQVKIVRITYLPVSS